MGNFDTMNSNKNGSAILFEGFYKINNKFFQLSIANTTKQTILQKRVLHESDLIIGIDNLVELKVLPAIQNVTIFKLPKWHTDQSATGLRPLIEKAFSVDILIFGLDCE